MKHIRNKGYRLFSLVIMLCLLAGLFLPGPVGLFTAEKTVYALALPKEEEEVTVEEDEEYTSPEEVAAYLHEFGHLPSNFITKKEARDLGWESSKGNLQKVAPGKSIGGDKFGNYEGQLPEKKGRTYKECDVNYEGGYRGEERIIFSNDGLIFYTDDHYNTFEQLY